ncbi:hypothetical protein BDN72DRAFT_781780, partial [Pluteus cervinus]
MTKSLILLNPVPHISSSVCSEGTRTEILQQIQQWTQTTSPQLFWLYGQAGTGKSAISQSIFSRFQATTVSCAFYTCSKTQVELHNPLNVLPTLCSQLCAHNNRYAKYIINQIDRNP